MQTQAEKYMLAVSIHTKGIFPVKAGTQGGLAAKARLIHVLHVHNCIYC